MTRCILVVSGIRDLAPASEPLVEMAVLDAVTDAAEIRFGGAIGVDTVALAACCAQRRDHGLPTTIRVVLPWTLHDQPREAQRWIACADHVDELRLPRASWAPLERNRRMLAIPTVLAGVQRTEPRVTRLLAFKDGRTTGGTAATIREARKRGIEVTVVTVASTRQTAASNPPLDLPDALAPIHAVFPYVSRARLPCDRSPGARATRVLLALKAGRVVKRDIEWLAGQLAAYTSRHFLDDLAFIAAMPRRRPGAPSDLDPLASAFARHAGKAFLANYLIRTAEPDESAGVFRKRRVRFDADIHASTLRVTQPRTPGDRVLLIDNVVASLRGTMIGAQMAIARDTGSASPGLAITFSTDLPVAP